MLHSSIQQIRLAKGLGGVDGLSTILVVTDGEGSLLAKTIGPEAVDRSRAVRGLSVGYMVYIDSKLTSTGCHG